MIGQTINDRYQIKAELGRGGMGTVYRAHDSALSRDVAVKLMSNTKLGTEGRARLMGEAQTVAQLNHPNIVTVFDVGVVDSLPYIIMELAEGKTLRDQIPTDWEQILAVAKQVIAALNHAHQHDVIHRDVKPENVAIDSDGIAKLMDFGIAHSVSSRITTDGMVIGTVSYMSPEQAMGKSVDARSDLYSLGVMLYEFAAGELPFEDNDPIAVISQHINAPIVPARARREDIPPGLDALISHLLEKDPGDRPASAQAVLTALEDPHILEESSASAKELSLLDRIVRGRMIGRRPEFDEARRYWNQASSGEGQFLLISGEPGIGKTRMMREIATHADVTGGRVLIGESFAEGNPPYGAFAQIVRYALDPQNGNGLTFPDFVLADMLTMAPDLKQYFPDIPPNPPLDPEAEKQRLLENAVAFVRILAESSPLLFVIDDIHWADGGTLAIIRHLSRRTRDLPVMLLATYREIELVDSTPFNNLLIELNRQRLGARIKLNRLDRAETQSLLQSLFAEDASDEFSNAIYKETEGNPFFIEEVCKSLIEEGKIYFEDQEWQRVAIEDLNIPQSIKVTIGARLTKLDNTVLEILRLAAILGREFDFDTLVSAADFSENEVINALEAAEDTQLTHEVSSIAGGHFSFAHALIPTTLVEGLSSMRRRKLHRQALLAVEAHHPEDYSSLALHSIAAGDLEKALKYSILAGDQAASAFTWNDALSQYQHAVEIADELGQVGHLVSVLEKLGDAYSNQGMLTESIDSYQKCLELTSEKIQKAIINTKMGNLFILNGHNQGLDYLESAQKTLSVRKHPEYYSQVLVGIGRFHHINGLHRKALDYFDQARAIAEPSDDPALLWRIYAYTAGAFQLLANYEESNHWANLCLSFGKEKNDLLTQALGLEYLSQNANSTGRYQAALEYIALEKKIAQQIGDRNRLGWILFSQAWAEQNLGYISLSLDLYQQSIDISNEVNDPRLEILDLGNLCIALSHLGEFDQAAKHGLRSVQMAEELEQSNMLRFSKNGLAYHYTQREQWQKALDLLDKMDSESANSDARAIDNWSLRSYAHAYWGLGDWDRATQKTEQALEHIKTSGSVQTLADIHCILAQINYSKKDWDQAILFADRAIKAAAPENYRLRWGRSLYWKAKILLAQKKTPEAKKAAQAALELFEYCGAQPDIDRTQNLLNTL